MDDEYIKDQKRSAHSIYRLLNLLPENTPPNYNQLIYDLTKYNPTERLELAIARLELESLFDDNYEESRESYHYEGRWLDNDDDLEIPTTPLSDSKSITTNPKNRENILKSRISSEVICDNWEKHSDDVIRRNLDILCHEYKNKPRNLLFRILFILKKKLIKRKKIMKVLRKQFFNLTKKFYK
ncbi:MAG: hypothetical protein C5B43_03240 [Verrucomicrobia bacterium]|nr:MAG: hypothetical protein C5B43_03240 [Verrucomicrobiota bacterium]